MKKRVLIIGLIVILVAIAIASYFSITGEIVNYGESEGSNFKCIDSDGNLSFDESIYVAGSVKSTKKQTGSERVGKDKCLSVNGNRVREYYCTQPGRLGFKEVNCALYERCSEGACVKG